METLFQTIGVVLRSLRRAPGFAAAALLTIALGVGINTAMFSLVDAVLLAPQPYPDAGRLTYISKGRLDQEGGRPPLSGPEMVALANGSPLHAGIGAIWPTTGTLVGDGRPEAVRLGMVTANFLTLLGTPPVRGRLFHQGDEGGAAPVTIISGDLWQSRFGGADVIGRHIRVDGGWGFDGGIYTVVGIMPPGFEMYLPLEASVPRTVDAWIPFTYDLAAAPPTLSFLRVIGRVTPGATLADAQQELRRAGDALVTQLPSAPPGRYFFAVPLDEDVVKRAKTPLLILQAAVGLVLLIACTNVATLMLVRGRAQRRDLCVRLALGASGRRLLTLLMTESLLLAAAGGLLGLVLAYVGLRVVPSLAPDTLPRAYEASLSLPVLGFCILATLGAGVLFGLTTLLQARRLDPLITLKGEGRGSQGGPPPRWRNVLVVVELCLSMVLLIGAGLLIRTFLNLRAVDPGYRWEHVVTFKLSLPSERYSAARLSQFTRELEHGLRAVPGVEAAGAINQLPLDDIPNWSTPYRTRTDGPSSDAGAADARLVTPGYFEALGATLVKGRWVTEQDLEHQPLVLMVDESLARKAWPGKHPIGQELAVEVATESGFQPRWGRVIGVIRHLRHHEPSEEVREQVFIPFAQAPRPQIGVVLKSELDAAALTDDITQRIRQLDSALAPAEVRPLAAYVEHKEAPARFTMALAGMFAVVSLLLACVGVYGVIAYAVTQRTSEFGVRAALGARTLDLVWLVLGHGMVLIALGLTFGLFLSFGAARWMKTLLFDVTTYDPITIIGATALLGLTALLASYVPARRAGAIDPARALRAE